MKIRLIITGLLVALMAACSTPIPFHGEVVDKFTTTEGRFLSGSSDDYFLVVNVNGRKRTIELYNVRIWGSCAVGDTYTDDGNGNKWCK